MALATSLNYMIGERMSGMKDGVEESIFWSSNKSVLDCNRYMLENEIDCDMVFVVGRPDGVIKEFMAHKYVCISRCPVFHAMLCGPLAPMDRRVIIDDVAPDSFYEVLRYLYFEEIELTENNIVDILYTAHKYQMMLLYRSCVENCLNVLDISNVWQALHLADLYDDDYLWTLAKSVLEKHNDEIQQGVGSFWEMPQATLERLLRDDNLYLPEETLYQLATRWADGTCRQGRFEEMSGIGMGDGGGVTDEQKRAELRDVLYQIRFPTMSLETFTRLTADSSLLTESEKLDVVYYIGDNKRRSRFESSLRHRAHFNVSLAELSAVSREQRSLSQLKSPVNFQTSKNVLLYSLGLHNLYKDEVCCLCEIILLETGNLVASSTSISMHQVNFPQPVQIAAGKMYQFQFTTKTESLYEVLSRSVVSIAPQQMMTASSSAAPAATAARPPFRIVAQQAHASSTAGTTRLVAAVRVRCGKRDRQEQRLLSPKCLELVTNGTCFKIFHMDPLVLKHLNFRATGKQHQWPPSWKGAAAILESRSTINS